DFAAFTDSYGFLQKKSVRIGEIREIRTSIRITICNLLNVNYLKITYL
ncbi:MAG: hypothetical protein RLZZ628_4372, partial [Bacteroidota bacterium]